MVIQRNRYVKRLADSIGNGLIKIITGVRRCGKSYLLFNLFYQHLLETGVDDECIVKIAFDNLFNEELRDHTKLLNYLKHFCLDNSNRYYFLFDEVQYLERFDEVLNTLLQYENIEVFATGSNSKFLSSDINTIFRGRSYEIHVLPLTYLEYIDFIGLSNNETLNTYISYGGLPKTVLLKKESEKIEYLKQLTTLTYFKDIIERNQIRDKMVLDELTKVLSSNVANLTNYVNLANKFESIYHRKLSVNTIESYTKMLEDSFIIKKVDRYDIGGNKIIGATRKFYFEDLGVRNSLLDFMSLDKGALMENAIYNELVYRGYTVNVGTIKSYEKNKSNNLVEKQLEVDFCSLKNGQKMYIQCCYKIDEEDKLHQETKSLLQIKDNFKKVLIVLDDVVTHYNSTGVLIISLNEFLKNESIL